MSVRRFRACEGRTVTLPAAVTEGTGNTRLDPGDIVDLETERLAPFGRFIANRVKLGDLVELPVTPSSPSSPTAPATPAKE